MKAPFTGPATIVQTANPLSYVIVQPLQFYSDLSEPQVHLTLAEGNRAATIALSGPEQIEELITALRETSNLCETERMRPKDGVS